MARKIVHREGKFWLSIKGSKRADDWRMYLTEYPEGRFAAIARLQLERFQKAASESKGKISLMGGTWEGWQEGKVTNSLQLDKENNRVWDYSVSKVNDDDYICISQDADDSLSVEGKQIRLSINSRAGVPVRFSLYSFVPGYSKEEDDETIVPGELYFP